MIFIMADEGKNGAGERLLNMIRSKGVEAEYLSLEGVRVESCHNCGACTEKTPGRCVTRDDGDWIYPKVEAADAVVVVTPVVFGGFSFRAKRVIDKFALFMDSHYFIQNGEMVKGGLRGRRFRYYVIGTGEVDDEEAEAFGQLVRETVFIVRGEGRALVMGASSGEEALRGFAAEVIGA